MGVAASVSAEICKEWMEAFTSMKFSGHEVERLHGVFNQVNFSGSGSIDSAELLAFLDIERTGFSTRIFTNFDGDHNGHVNFYEFVLSCWKLLAMKQKSLYSYVFDLYDMDGVGELAVKDFLRMVRDLDSNHHTEAANSSINRWATDAGKDDKINVQAFGEFCSTHETLLHSAHDLQTRLKDRVLGSAFWDGVAARELFLWKKEKVSVAQLLDTYSNRATFNALLHNPEILKNRPLCNLLESISCARGPATPVGSLKSLPARSNPKLVLTFKHPQAQAQQAPRRRSRVKSVGHAPVSVSGGGGGAAGGHSHSHSHSHNHSHTPSSSENIPVLTPRPRTPTVHLISKGAKLRVPGDVGSAQMFGAPLLISEC